MYNLTAFTKPAHLQLLVQPIDFVGDYKHSFLWCFLNILFVRIDPSEGQLVGKKFPTQASLFWSVLTLRVCWFETFPPACVSVLERIRLNSSVSEPAEFMSQRKQKNRDPLLSAFFEGPNGLLWGNCWGDAGFFRSRIS